MEFEHTLFGEPIKVQVKGSEAWLDSDDFNISFVAGHIGYAYRMFANLANLETPMVMHIRENPAEDLYGKITSAGKLRCNKGHRGAFLAKYARDFMKCLNAIAQTYSYSSLPYANWYLNNRGQLEDTYAKHVQNHVCLFIRDHGYVPGGNPEFKFVAF